MSTHITEGDRPAKAESNSTTKVPVVDVDQVFPSMPGGTVPQTSAGSSPSDLSPQVRAALRDVLGVRTREEDPKAFIDALTASFRLVRVEGHIESEYVPRGYAVQADLGAVSGGQASLYRRAMLARTETLRILDGLQPLRMDADPDDMDAYRVLVRNGIESVVAELGAPGGPRVAMVDSYFAGLVGKRPAPDPDQVAGQLGALRERFGLVDANVNTIEEEGIRTSYWTLVDLVTDLRKAWLAQRDRFTGSAGHGFLGTELISLSRLMEAASDQVEELESVLDSVLIGVAERRTVRLDTDTNLTLDGLLSWLRSFLADEGRRLATDAGRDGIVSALVPTAIALFETFKTGLADKLTPRHDSGHVAAPVRYLPVSTSHELPAGMYTGRVSVAVAGLSRLLRELARSAQRVGRWAGVVLVEVSIAPLEALVDDESGTEALTVEFRGLNLRPTYLPAFVPPGQPRGDDEDARTNHMEPRDLIQAIGGSVTADEESISGIFPAEELCPVLNKVFASGFPWEPVVLPASQVPLAIIDGETGRVVHAPTPTTWPRLVPASDPRERLGPGRHRNNRAARAGVAASDRPDAPPTGGGGSDGTGEPASHATDERSHQTETFKDLEEAAYTLGRKQEALDEATRVADDCRSRHAELKEKVQNLDHQIEDAEGRQKGSLRGHRTRSSKALQEAEEDLRKAQQRMDELTREVDGCHARVAALQQTVYGTFARTGSTTAAGTTGGRA